MLLQQRSVMVLVVDGRWRGDDEGRSEIDELMLKFDNDQVKKEFILLVSDNGSLEVVRKTLTFFILYYICLD